MFNFEQISRAPVEEEGRISTAGPDSTAPINTALLADHFANEQELAPSRGLVHGIKIAMVFWMTTLLGAGAFYLFL